MKDELLLAENNGALREEIKNLKDEIRELENKNNHLSNKVYFKEIWDGLSGLICLIVVITLIGVFCVYPFYMYMISDSIPSHCQIVKRPYSNNDNEEDDNTSSYNVYGIIPWNRDIYYGSFETLEDVQEFMEIISCEIK